MDNNWRLLVTGQLGAHRPTVVTVCLFIHATKETKETTDVHSRIRQKMLITAEENVARTDFGYQKFSHDYPRFIGLRENKRT